MGSVVIRSCLTGLLFLVPPSPSNKYLERGREKKKEQHEIECEVITMTEIFFDDFSYLYFFLSFQRHVMPFMADFGDWLGLPPLKIYTHPSSLVRGDFTLVILLHFLQNFRYWAFYVG